MSDSILGVPHLYHQLQFGSVQNLIAPSQKIKIKIYLLWQNKNKTEK